MAQAKAEEPAKPVADTEEDHWAHYRSIQLTPEQVAAGRARLQKEIDKARAAGVYEGLMKWKGKVHWEIDLDELRKDREFDSD
ncbi:MAG: hypothetical protein QOE82_2583 [Thermoanaerobaculia bacterium]|jgi:hypothetical protein|nr:hypothetical protein [Thermoanaerobaculia bacterium]